MAVTDGGPELDDVAARALASMILDATAVLLTADGVLAETTILGLSADTGLTLDIAAGILTATSWLAGTGELAAEAVFAGSLGFVPSEAEPQ